MVCCVLWSFDLFLFFLYLRKCLYLRSNKHRYALRLLFKGPPVLQHKRSDFCSLIRNSKSHLPLQPYSSRLFSLSLNIVIFRLDPSFSPTLGTLFCLPTGKESRLGLLAGLALIGFARISYTHLLTRRWLGEWI